MSRRPDARALPQNATICGWCDEYEARAKLAEQRAAEVEASIPRHVADALAAERAVREWLTQCLDPDGARWGWGQSAQCMILFALGFRRFPRDREFPIDADDLRRCQRVRDCAPEHLHEPLDFTLARYRTVIQTEED